MKNLSKREWAVLESMAIAFCDNLEQSGVSYYWTTGATLVKEEVDLLKKLANK